MLRMEWAPLCPLAVPLGDGGLRTAGITAGTLPAMLRPTLLALLLVPACVIVATAHSVRTRLQLGASGQATVTLEWTAPPAVSVRVDNVGPGRVSYTALDAAGATLEQGELGVGARNLSWKRADGKVLLVLRAGPQPATLELYCASQESVKLAIDRTLAGN